MLAPVLDITPVEARRFARRALLLDRRAPSVAAAIEHHGYIQLDPVNVCGRMQDLILRNRVSGYREGDLMRHLHGDETPLPIAARVGFEHHLPSSAILVAFALDAWPHLLAAMKARTRRSSAWSGWLTARERELAVRILAEIAARGPLSSEQIDDDRRGRRVWGSATLAKSTLQKLFFHGRVLIARRVNNRRFYDLPERVLPPHVLAATVPAAEDTARWLALIKLRQRRLVTLKRGEIPLVTDIVQPLRVESCAPLFCLREDLPLFESNGAGEDETTMETLLLAPLDPLIYDRRLTHCLWNFDYVWEAYMPAHKRVRGHYALPVLAGTELVGHVEPKANRSEGRLRVLSRRVRRGYKVAAATGDLAKFLELRRR